MVALTDDLRPIRARDVGLFLPATCGKGHGLTDGNYRISRNGTRGWRWQCLTCVNTQNRARLTAAEKRQIPAVTPPRTPCDDIERIAWKHGLDKIRGEDAVEWLRVTYRALSPAHIQAFRDVNLDGVA